jgi:glyoxylase-like metal-dependent hydrolase (beta-lactamase superfamily II)
MSTSRRAFLTASAFGFVSIAAGRAWARTLTQERPAAPTGTFTPIRGDVGYFTGRGGTIGYLINRDGVVVVDSQFMDSARVCIAGLAERSNNRPIDLLINTHHHGDHTGGNMAFKGVAQHVLANARAAELQRQVYETAVKNAEAKGDTAPAEILVADRTFTTTWSQEVGNQRVTARTYTPAHTSGDAIVHFERANVVHMGDLLFNRSHPVIDRAAGASIQNWMVKLDEIGRAHSRDTIFIAGHSGGADVPVVCAQADVVVMKNYLNALLEFVKKQIAAGKTREEIVAMRDVLPGFESHGPLVARPLGPAYDELTNK